MSLIRAFIAIAVALPQFLVEGPASAGTTLGRWCDRMLPSMPQYNAIITIRLNADGAGEAHIAFGDGSQTTRALREVSGDMFEVIDSPSGDKYRMVPASGDLQLIDNDGLIRVARRLENRPVPRECGL